MLFVGTSIIHPSTEGVFLLCNILDLLIYSINFQCPHLLSFENGCTFIIWQEMQQGKEEQEEQE